MTTRHIVVISAGLSQPSSTRLLADRLGEATDRALRLYDEQVDVEVVELRDHAHALTDRLLTGFATGELAEVIEAVEKADAVIAVTPIFSASYTGLFKTFFDILDEGTLEGTPVLIAATAGTARHSLALEFALRPLFAYLRANVAATAVFAATEDFGGDSGLAGRIERAGRELADLVHGERQRGTVDPFANPTPFEELLGR